MDQLKTTSTRHPWKTIRIDAATYTRLSSLRDDMFAAYQSGVITLPDDQAEWLSFNHLVGILISHLEDHRKRAAKQRMKGKFNERTPQG